MRGPGKTVELRMLYLTDLFVFVFFFSIFVNRFVAAVANKVVPKRAVQCDGRFHLQQWRPFWQGGAF